MYETPLQTRYLKAKLSYKNKENEIKEILINIEPPKMKALQKITEAAKKINLMSSEDKQSPEKAVEIIDDMLNILALILNKNKENFKFSNDLISEIFDEEEMENFIFVYLKWVNEARKNPN